MTIENELLEVQAKVLVEELLMRRYSRTQVQRAMASHTLRLSKAECDRLIRQIKEEWLSASESVREERREQQRRSLENLYRKAYEEKKYSICLGVERLLADIDGTMAPKRVQVSAAGPREEDEFSDRSEIELEYFAKHGHFPDEVH